MIKQKRYLITTSDEKTWKYDCPVIFLGEWCRIYERKNIWKDMNADVLKPYGLGVLKKKEDYYAAKEVEDNIFPLICDLLNQHHRTQHPISFWWIFLGPWFKKIVKLLINRVNTLNKCIETYEISGTTTYNIDNYSLSSLDYLSAYGSFRDPQWNNILNYKILGLLKEIKFPVKIIEQNINPNTKKDNNVKISFNKRIFRKKFLNLCLKFYSKISRKLIRENDAFILSTYLPLKEEIKLEIALGQWPQIWGLYWNKSTWPTINNKPNRVIRESLKRKFLKESENQLETITRSLLFELIPICYLEGYKNLAKIADNQLWPKSPKFIFTSVNYNTDDVFKFWAANKVVAGSPYFIGQHGNSYGTRWDNVDCIEEVTPDKFITWGWKDGSSKHFPAFVINTAAKKKKNYSLDGNLLLIETINWDPFTTWDNSSEFVKYLNDQKKFINQLFNQPRQKLVIRLHPGYKNDTWSEDIMWYDFDPSIKIDDGSSDITDLIARSRLVVHSYDSTGILVTLSQNVPTLAFWQNGFDHLRESAKPYYQLLVDAGIIHLSVESIANKVNKIWDDVDGWWNQAQVQNARRKFCKIYARTYHTPISELRKVLLS